MTPAPEPDGSAAPDPAAPEAPAPGGGTTASKREPLLSRIRQGSATPAETWTAALSGGSSDELVSHAVVICRDRGYAPDDPADRAALFVLSGQVARYRELDPENALLAQAYQGAPQRLRRRLRAAMSEVGDVDVVAVVTGDGRRALAETERDYLVRTLTGRRAWDDLWRLVLQLPLIHAVDVARDFDGWQPPKPRDRALFDRLLAVRRQDFEGLSAQASALFERQPVLLRKTIPGYLSRTPESLVELLRARIAVRYGEQGD